VSEHYLERHSEAERSAEEARRPEQYLERRSEAERLAEEARRLDKPPRYEGGKKVKVRGQRLSKPIYWQGRQWAVTPFGVECRDGNYHIEAERIWDGDDEYGGWVMHMSTKNWVDLEDFAEALRIARRRQKREEPRRKS
jgi:hypothetical protein